MECTGRAVAYFLTFVIYDLLLRNITFHNYTNNNNNNNTSRTRNIIHYKECATIWNLKPERWCSTLDQVGKYHEIRLLWENNNSNNKSDNCNEVLLTHVSRYVVMTLGSLTEGGKQVNQQSISTWMHAGSLVLGPNLSGFVAAPHSYNSHLLPVVLFSPLSLFFAYPTTGITNHTLKYWSVLLSSLSKQLHASNLLRRDHSACNENWNMYSGHKITASLENITVREEKKRWKGQGVSTTAKYLSMYSIT
jgi:hypothetical protein